MNFFITFNFTLNTNCIIHKMYFMLCNKNITYKELCMAYLSFSISKSVTQKEWSQVYEETLVLADKLNLADWEKFYYKGVRSYAYRKVKEQTEINFGEEKHFWLACGDYNYMNEGEYFRLEREIDNYDKNAVPAILGQLYSYTNKKYKIIENQIRTRDIKIFGGTYYIRLLAILCFMESKLKEKIFIYGDFDKHDCEIAIDIINNNLNEQIELPARCDFNRLYNIVKKLDISDEEKIYLMEESYLGNIDLKYKKLIEEIFGKEKLNKFWKDRFKDCEINSYDFQKKLEAYLSYGFAFKDLFSYIQFNNTKEDYKKFLELIIKIENNRNNLSRSLGITIDPKDNKVRGFSQEFCSALFAIENSITENYYTIDDYVNELSKYFGNYIDVRDFLKERIEYQDEDTFLSKMKEYCHKNSYNLFEDEKKFDIVFPHDLMFYKTGDKIAPSLMDRIQNAVKNNKNRLADKEFKDISTKEITEQIYELIDIHNQFPVRDIDWYHAIDYFNTHSDALERYYPLFHMRLDLFSQTQHIARALFINDEFYEFCKGL